MNRFLNIILLIIVLFCLLFFQSAYKVDETQQVIITQFGRPVGKPIIKPGLHFKMPFIQKATYFAKNLLEWDGDPGEIPTLDKTYIWVDTFARWKITDPLRFFQSVINEDLALKKMDDIIDPAVRNFITSFSLIEVVRNSNRPMVLESTDFERETDSSGKIVKGREEITKGILEQAKSKLKQLGIELVDVRIKRIDYVEEVRKKVFDRMIAERKQIAEKFRSEGQGESRKIEGDMEKELKRITSEAYKTAQEIKGEADAEATKIYAEAYSKDSEFFSFVKTLDLYKKTLDKDSMLMLSTKSDFFKYLQKYEAK
ncbi:MAG: protease modulator HflC [Thermodesulfobacteriota bacterium]|nr:protease modulator HflC [Thermodesulfobacteriota bacterium]